MARQSKWSKSDREKLLKMVNDGVAEQEIREVLGSPDSPMSSAVFAQQLKISMVESGKIKQASRTKTAKTAKSYEVTAKGRLTITDFTEVTGMKSGEKFTLESPRGKSKAWRLVPLS
ncbi:MAG: hypothetical protein KQJ78_17205 [Deltaproteobacteria bacterium]|nr:hypothetical protein [Deltaproteobacteria bacterium]